MSRTRNLSVMSPILYHYTTAPTLMRCLSSAVNFIAVTATSFVLYIAVINKKYLTRRQSYLIEIRVSSAVLSEILVQIS